VFGGDFANTSHLESVLEVKFIELSCLGERTVLLLQSRDLGTHIVKGNNLVVRLLFTLILTGEHIGRP